MEDSDKREALEELEHVQLRGNDRINDETSDEGGGGSLPNDPECANFASILRLLLIGAISTQPCYVSTLCVDIAPIIRVCKFAQI